MARLEKFEDIEAWKQARLLTKRIYEATSHGDFSRDFALRDQIRRAAISVASNIAEGFERGGNREFIQFLAVAKGSVGEVQAQLYVALDAGHISQAQFDELRAIAGSVTRLLGGFIRYLQNSELKGRKFKPADLSDAPNSEL